MKSYKYLMEDGGLGEEQFGECGGFVRSGGGAAVLNQRGWQHKVRVDADAHTGQLRARERERHVHLLIDVREQRVERRAAAARNGRIRVAHVCGHSRQQRHKHF